MISFERGLAGKVFVADIGNGYFPLSFSKDGDPTDSELALLLWDGMRYDSPVSHWQPCFGDGIAVIVPRIHCVFPFASSHLSYAHLSCHNLQPGLLCAASGPGLVRRIPG